MAVLEVYSASSPVYATIRRGTDGKVLEPGVGYVDWDDADIADYAVALTDKGGDLFQAEAPSGMEPGPYFVAYYVQAGAAPATTDTAISSGDRLYTGTDLYSPYARRLGVFDANGAPVYAIIRRVSDGFVKSGSVFVEWADADIEDYASNLADAGGDFWYFSESLTIGAGEYVVAYYRKASELDPPQITDTLISQSEVTWSEPLSAYALTSLASVKAHLRLSTSQYDGVLVDLINSATAHIEQLTGRKIIAREHYEWRQIPNSKRMALRNYPIIALRRVAIGRTAALSAQHTESTDIQATVGVTADRVQLQRITSAGAVVNDEFTFALVKTTAAIATAGATGWTITAPLSVPTAQLEPFAPADAKGTTATMYYPSETIGAFALNADAGVVELSPALRQAWIPGGERMMVAYRGGYETAPSDLAQLCRAMVSRMFRELSLNQAAKSESIGDYSYTLADAASVMAGESAIIARYASGSSFVGSAS